MMRKFLFLTVVASFGLAMSLQAQTASSPVSMVPIIKKGQKFAEKLEKEHPGALLQRVEYDLALFDNYTYMDMSEKLDYVVSSIADESVKKYTLKIFQRGDDGELKMIASKPSNDKGEAVLQFDPTTSEKYAIDVHVDEYADPNKVTGHVGIFVLVQTRPKN